MVGLLGGAAASVLTGALQHGAPAGWPVPPPVAAAAAEAESEALAALRRVTELQKLAFEYTNDMRYERAETIWTRIIALNEGNAAAWSNRGNCRTSQGRFDDAIADFDRAVALAPAEPDPYLGRGVAREGLRQYAAALADYEAANAASVAKYKTEDAVAYNNMGNAHAGQAAVLSADAAAAARGGAPGAADAAAAATAEWAAAAALYHRAASMDRQYVFASANEALALYQLGDTGRSLRLVKYLCLKYPQFADMHAVLAAAYWAQGRAADAESEWATVLGQDSRYGNIGWVEDVRRWPPVLVARLKDFLQLRPQAAG